MQIAFRCHKQLGSLGVQILTIFQEDNRGILECVAVAQHNEPGQEQHRIGLATAGCSEIGTAFSIAVRPHVQFDVGEHLFCGEKLRIPADNDFIL